MNTADRSALGKKSRARGHRTERLLVNWLKEHGYPDAETSRGRLGTDGTKQPGDIAGLPGITMDAKVRAGTAWPTWLRQVEAEAIPGTAAVVVRHIERTTPPRWIAACRAWHVRPWPDLVTMDTTPSTYLTAVQEAERTSWNKDLVLVLHRSAPGGPVAVGRLPVLLEALA